MNFERELCCTEITNGTFFFLSYFLISQNKVRPPFASHSMWFTSHITHELSLSSHDDVELLMVRMKMCMSFHKLKLEIDDRIDKQR